MVAQTTDGRGTKSRARSRARSRAADRRRGPRVRRAYRRAMFQVMLGSILAFSIADANIPYFVLTSVGVLLAWVLSVAPQRPAPRMAINTVLLLVIVVAGIEMLRVGVGVSAFAVFVALLLVVKLLDLRTARDDGQVLVLSVSILIAAVLTSNAFSTGLMMVLVSVLVLRAVVLYQIHAVVGKSARGQSRISEDARIDIRSMMLAAGFICVIVGGLIFVVLPRNVGSQAFGQWGNIARSVSGFSDEVELGRPGLISMSTTPVLDLTVTDRNGQNIGAESSPPFYLRGAVLEEYDAGRWVRSSIMRTPLTDRIKIYPPSSTLQPKGAFDHSRWDRQFSITLRRTSDGPIYLFAPWRPVEFRVNDEPMRLGLDFTRGLFLKDGIGGSVEYAVRCVDVEFLPIDYASLESRDPVTPTQIEPRIAELARRVLTDAGIDPDPATRPLRDDASAVRVLETFLRTRYSYTLDAQPVPSGEDATEWFLFERKTGHCEYYASALALMSRSLGIPARVITGYVVSDFNPVTGQYVVRESNAHAWVEAEIAPDHWRTFDGTPPGDFHSIHVREPGLARTISRLYESIEFFWVRTVVGYDAAARQDIMGTKNPDFGISRLSDRLLDRYAAGRSRLVMRAAVVAGLVFAGSMFVGIVLLKHRALFNAGWAWLSGLLGGIRPLARRGRGGDELGEELERVVRRRLSRLGAPKPDWIPLKAHLVRCAQQIDAGSREALGEAARVLYRRRFAADSAPMDRRELLRLIGALRRSEKRGGENPSEVNGTSVGGAS